MNPYIGMLFEFNFPIFSCEWYCVATFFVIVVMIYFIFILTQIRVRVEKDPELGFSISGGVGGRGNPFKPDDDVSYLYII